MKRTVRISIVLLISLGVIFGVVKLRRNSRASIRASIADQNDLVVHEWGTFTSIAGKDGVALEWRPLNGSVDLPKFVHTMEQEGLGLRHVQSKAELSGLIRMETPVLYFYSKREMNVSAEVNFPKGKITEWYPQARSVGSAINWGTFKVAPGAAFNLPADYSENHYYAARETDAAPLQVCGSAGKAAEQEKFLFYRGVGDFDLPLSVKLERNEIELKNTGKDSIARLIIFENRDGKIGYRIVDNFSGQTTADLPTLDKSVEAVIRDLRETLVASGLYEKEADAMIKTWRNSWFEEGMRVFYILPRKTIDEVLPISIEPKPTQLVRVLVGRTEVITPEMEKSVRKQVSLLSNS
ncbi:MAG TPA: hypothetical protein VEL78_05205, partial [Pyrinomonadaceae bacterium]|nr:hypothetical protein [Pyrinomonadaceae bacterium]